MSLKEQMLIGKNDCNELRSELKEMNIKYTRLLEDVSTNRVTRPNTAN
jgi:hypothetical protein